MYLLLAQLCVLYLLFIEMLLLLLLDLLCWSVVYLSSFYFVGHDESSNGFEHKVQKVGGGDSKFNYFDPPRHN